VAFAIERWDLVSEVGQQYLDPLNAWFYRLNQAQREAVLAASSWAGPLHPHPQTL